MVTPAQRHARASQTHVLSHDHRREGCYNCSPWHSVPRNLPPGTEPPLCGECELDRQEGVRRWRAR